MHDPLELPQEIRVKIPRIRNGDLIATKSADADEERARLLGILAIMIAETTNGISFHEARVEPEYMEMALVAKEARQNFVQQLKEAMAFLMYNDLESFLAILEGIQAQAEAESAALSVFSNFIRTIE